MAEYKDILVYLDTPDSADSVLQTSLLTAKKFKSHLEAFHIHQGLSAILPLPIISSDLEGIVASEVVETEEKEMAETADEMRYVFEKFVEKHVIQPKTEAVGGLEEITAEYRELYDYDEEAIAWCSRVSDLIVLAKPDQNAKASFSALNVALMESGSAVLLAPLTIPDTIGERIAIAWDASEEAAKAVTLALPFLEKAKEVVILETETPVEALGDAKALVKRLAWHGISAQILKLPENSSVSAKGDEIIKQAGGRFDLLVMGAYTQSSMRRWILGSTTKYLVENADMALFLAH